mgnify:FL=1
MLHFRRAFVVRHGYAMPGLADHEHPRRWNRHYGFLRLGAINGKRRDVRHAIVSSIKPAAMRISGLLRRR